MGSLRGEKIFITGATGFVGSNLVRRSLQEGAEIFVNIRNSSDTWRIANILKDVSIIHADITEYDKMNEAFKKICPDVIFHTAVYGGNSAQKDTGKIIDSNISGTLNLLRCCKNIHFELFVNTGSSSEYGIKNTPMKESDLLNPVTDYGVSKAAATLFCQKTGRTENLPIVTLRLFSPFGPYEQKSRLIPSIILAALQKQNPYIASRDFVRDFIFIDDVVEAYVAALNLKNPHGQIYNIGSGLQSTVGTVTDTIINLLGREVTCTTGFPQSWEYEPAFWQADICRAISELRWTPRNTLEQGLKKTIDWFKQNVKLYT
jgi:nucleoside-diphosphate-sugar epimerase